MFRSVVVRALQLGALFGGLCWWQLSLRTGATNVDDTVGLLLLSAILSFLLVMVMEWLRLNRAIETLTGVLKRAAEPVPPRPERWTRGLGFALFASAMGVFVICAGLLRNKAEFLIELIEKPEDLAGFFLLGAPLIALLFGVYTALILRLAIGAWTLRRFTHLTAHLSALPRPDFPKPIPGLIALAAAPLALLYWMEFDFDEPALDSGSTVLVFELGPDDAISELDSRLVALSPQRVHDPISQDPSGLNQQYFLKVSASDQATALSLLNGDSENVEWAESASVAQLPPSTSTGDCRYQTTGFGPTNDPYAKRQHSLQRTEIVALMERSAWANRKPTPVAVVDQGIDASHPDLNGVVSGGGRGSEHGTAVAGVLAAKSNNQVGITSTNLNGERIRVLDFSLGPSAQSASFQIADAITDAVDEGSKVINLSLAGPGSMPIVVSEAIDYAEGQGVLVVAAAGNNATLSHWPARHRYVLSVSSTDAAGGSSIFNGSGADLKAPGQEVCTTLVGGGYGLQTGTSYAAPYVSGVAASLLYLCPRAEPAALRKALISTASGGEIRANQAYQRLYFQGLCSSF